METKVVSLEVNSNLAETEKSVGSLKAQLRQAQAEVAVLSDKFGATSKEAVQAAKRAGELADKIGDAKALTDAFNPDAKFKALSSSLGGVAGGFAAVQGGMGLIGVESKDLEKQLLKVQSAMALSQGLQSVGESIDSFKQLGAVLKNTSLVQKAMTVATATYNFVNTAATNGLKLFRLALIGTGIGAVVVAVGLLVANFDKVKNAVMNLIPGLANVGEFLGNIVNAVTDFVGATSETERALDRLKENADKTLTVNKKFMQEHGDQVDEYTKKKIDAKNAYAEAIKEDGANQVELAKRLNRELAKIDKERDDERDKKAKEAQDKKDAVNAKAKEKQDALDKIEKDKLDKQKEKELKDFNDFQIAVNNAQFEQKTIDKQNTEDSFKQLTDTSDLFYEQDQASAKANADAKIEIAKSEAKAKADAIDFYGGALSSISGMLGESTAAGKAAAIASATIATYSSANKAYESQLAIPTPDAPVRATIASGIAIAGGLLNVKKILSVKTPNGGGGGSVPSGGGAPVAPNFNVVGTSGQNQIAQTLGKEQPPVKAYVVANDVTTQQSLNRNIVQSASIGG